MNMMQLTLVRIYLTESEHAAKTLLQFLHDRGLRGATLMRAISGFGQAGHWHQANWADLVGDLPLVLEFVDTPEKIGAVLPELLEKTDPGHVMTWPVQGYRRPDRS